MSKDQVQSQYDAFISYRHSDLDSFVAENLQKELEAFSLPKNMRKKLEKGAKTKISRVFRDSTELPIAANLSDPIYQALQRSDYLVVICTPRLRESIWCQKEIDNFIEMHGRERILAVLAEGEPRDSFPEQICRQEVEKQLPDGRTVTYYEAVEPLAADVRGDSRKVVKKKIKEEVIRLVSPIFGCAYDDLKQRHREQKIRRRFAISTAISTVLLAFGCFSLFQALRISKQSDTIKEQLDTIKDQYETIEEQYLENQLSTERVMIDSSFDKIAVGDYPEAARLAVEALPEDLANPAYAIDYRAQDVLARAMRVYDTGYALEPYRVIEQDTGVRFIYSLGYGRILTTDAFQTARIWDIETGRMMTEFNTGATVLDQELVRLDVNDNVLYIDEAGLHCLDAQDYSEKWFFEVDSLYVMTMNYDRNEVLAVNKEGIWKLDAESGKLINSLAFLQEGERLYEVSAIQYDSISDMIFLVYNIYEEDGESSFYSFGNGKYITVSISYDDFEILDRLESEASGYIDATLLYEGGAIAVAYYGYVETDDFFDLYSWVEKYSVDQTGNLTKGWRIDAVEMISDIRSDFANEMLVIYNSLAAFHETTEGKMTRLESFDAGIIQSYPLRTSGYLFLCTGGEAFYERGDDYQYDMGRYKILGKDLAEYVLSGMYYVTRENQSNRIVIYDMSMSKYYEPEDSSRADELLEERTLMEKGVIGLYNPEESRLELDQDRKCLNLYSESGHLVGNYECAIFQIQSMGLDERSNYVYVTFYNGQVDILDASTMEYVASIQLKKDINSFQYMDENYVALIEVERAYVVNKETMQLVAIIPQMEVYDPERNRFIVDSFGEYYSIPFFTLEELVEMYR